MNYKEMAQACNQAAMVKTKGLLEDFGTVLDALMILYLDLDKHKGYCKYGPMDAASAYRALYLFMQAREDLVRVEATLDEVRHVLRATSDDLYGAQR